MKLDKVINFFKSKSVVDIVYLVMMILIVTIIKDMIVSMYRKRKDKQWLNQAFGKTKGKKNVEGFSTGTTWTTGDCGSQIDDSSTSTASVCDRLKFLLCNDNFSSLFELLKFLNTETNWKVNIDLKKDSTLTTGVGTIDPYLQGSQAPSIKNVKKLINIIDKHFLHENHPILREDKWKNFFIVEKIIANEMAAPHIGPGTVWGDLNVSDSLSVSDSLTVKGKIKTDRIDPDDMTQVQLCQSGDGGCKHISTHNI